MDEFGSPLLESIPNIMRKKRSQTARRPRLEAPTFPESGDWSPLSSTPTSDDTKKVSSEENDGQVNNSRKKVLNLDQCGSMGYSAFKADSSSQKGWSASNCNKFSEGFNVCSRQSGLTMNGIETDNKSKRVKLKVGGVTCTIQTKFGSHGVSGNGSYSNASQPSDVPQHRQKLILQDNSDEYHSFPLEGKSAVQGIPRKGFSRIGSIFGKEESLMGKVSGKNATEKGEKLDLVRKSKRVPKRRVLDGEFDEEDEDDEIRYLEKLKSSKVASGYRDFDEESSKKQKNLSKLSKDGKYDNSEDGKKSKLERVSEDAGYEESEETASDCEPGGKMKKQKKDPSDSPPESKKAVALTTRQRALLSSKDGASASSASPIEFPNGLPPPPSRKLKEKLSEVDQQLKKVEAAQRRRMQNEKAARESEAEAIRKILGQDSNRKKREDKMKKRQVELAQKKAANAEMLASNTIRWIMGPTGTVVTFPMDLGLPHIFDQKPCIYPPPREKCAGPFCNNPYKYRDSKSKLPLCSLECYKAIHEKTVPETSS